MAFVIGYECETCATDCDDFVLPAVITNKCANAVTVELSEINMILWAENDPTNPGKALGGPSDWTSAAAWDTAIDDSGAGKVRTLIGVGDIPEPEDVTIQIHDGISKVIARKRSLNFSQFDRNTVNYDFFRKIQCGGNGRIWWTTRGGWLYGGADGVGVDVPPPSDPFNRGNDSYVTSNYRFLWDALCSPERVASPFAANAPAPPTT